MSRFCVDCKWCELDEDFPDGEHSKCGAPSNLIERTNLVTGKTETTRYYDFCSVQRRAVTDPKTCTVEGLWWEPKTDA